MTFAKFPKIHGALMRALDAYAKDVNVITVHIREPGVVSVTLQRGRMAQSGEFPIYLEAGSEDQVREDVGYVVRELVSRLDRLTTPKPVGPGAAWSHVERRPS